MTKHRHNLVWMDLEMTGLNPEWDRIIEVATIITDGDLNIIAQGPVIAINQPDKYLESMDAWNTRTHNETGLVMRVMESETSEEQAEKQTLAFIKEHVHANVAPLCGNSICQDRRFLYRYMPTLSKFLHYRNVDVTSVKELADRWNPDIVSGFKKKNTHKELDDINDSIREL
ncbi:MAG: oligoribonuclease, partial [Arenicellales bacterium]